MAHPVTELECVRSVFPSSLELSCDVGDIIGMNSQEPLVRAGADVVVFRPSESGPARRVVDAVRDDVPVPQSVGISYSVHVRNAARIR